MFSKKKGFTLVELLIVIIVIGILAGGMMLASGSATDAAKASTLISELRNAKAGGIMLMGDFPNMPFLDLVSSWTTVPTIGSFDIYMDNPLKVQDLIFETAMMATPAGTPTEALLIGKNVGDPIVAEKMIGMVGGALFNATGGLFTLTDPAAFMRVK
ncbi:MAG: prepilin-type N-terminal cleavage/methylation domain-containing protein [Synergistaceae bacterium]|nr:prepilin-type N-terminal cleavage/methylation domain-containing protein [Synergistaceae bacterium]